MYASRWLLAPIYLGLSLALIILAIKFFQKVWLTLPHILDKPDIDIILMVLSLVDVALVGGLVIMVMFSGYENFVSTIDVDENTEKLGWLGKLDTGSLKNKVAASIVAISSIHLLGVFMNANDYQETHLKWYVIIHLTFVLSAFAMGYLDRMNKKS